MGWSGGADVMRGIVDAAKQAVSSADERKALYLLVVDVLEGQDGCRFEFEGSAGKDPAFDAALRALGVLCDDGGDPE